MFSFLGQGTRLCSGFSRREWLRLGGLSTVGLSLPQLLQARDLFNEGVPVGDKTFGRARSVIFLYLLGGPPQHETFDPKPDAPAEVRGPFQPIQTNVPGIQFCELLPRIAQIADKLAIVRSISTDDNNHDSSGYQLLTGNKYIGPNSRTIQPTDWPYFGSLVKMLKPSDLLPPLSVVTVPDVWRLNENVTPAGQTAGFLGGQWNPNVFVGDPSRRDYKVEGLNLSHLPAAELRRREALLQEMEQRFALPQREGAARLYEKFQTQAFDLLTSTRARDAFDLTKEPDAVRNQYGRTQWGQSLLLARRLVEAGVRLVHVNWPREPGDNAVDNPLWDTHAQNADRVEDVLCPLFDVSFSTLIRDLEDRGLLSETLVVAIGEFGRTPKINGNGGRDHWGHVFSFAMAGAGIRGGQVYGSSDVQGAFPAKDRCSGGDFTATMFHLLGIPHTTTFFDREKRAHPLTPGQPLWTLLGSGPATTDRQESTADLARVPPFDDRPLRVTDFAPPVRLDSMYGSSRPKNWRAEPLLSDGAADTRFGVALVQNRPANERATVPTEPIPTQPTPPTDRLKPATSPTGNPVADRLPFARIGFAWGPDLPAAGLIAGQKAVLAQEVRSPFAGRYRLRVQLAGLASSQAAWERLFQPHFRCQLVYFQFTTPDKTPLQRRDLAAQLFVPQYQPLAQVSNVSLDDFRQMRPVGSGRQLIELEKVFENPTPGGNFSFGLGLGVALVVERTTTGELPLEAVDRSGFVALAVEEFRLDFTGKARKDDVVV